MSSPNEFLLQLLSGESKGTCNVIYERQLEGDLASLFSQKTLGHGLECSLNAFATDELQNIPHIAERFVGSDWIIIFGMLEEMSNDDASLLLGMLRNSSNAKIVVFHERKQGQEEAITVTEKGLSFNDFIGLGFKRMESFEHTNGAVALEAFAYNIENYNKKREWNSPKNWANPEMFGKYWW